MLIYLNGLLLGLSLIMALGPQNIFLIKQGIQKKHALLSAIVCFFCDIILVSISIAGIDKLLLLHPTWQIGMVCLGSLFLLYYGLKNLKSAFITKSADTRAAVVSHTKKQIILFALGFSLLNPHAIIDSLLIIGSGSNQFPDQKPLFMLGVITASLIWFSSLTVTTRFFANILSQSKVWQMIELCSGLLMIYLGIKLALA